MVKHCPISLWGVSLSRLLPRRNLSYNWRTKKTSFLLCLHFCSLLCPSAPVPCELFSGRRIWLKPDMCFLLKTLCTQTEKGMGGYHITLSTVEAPVHLISTQAFNFHSKCVRNCVCSYTGRFCFGYYKVCWDYSAMCVPSFNSHLAQASFLHYLLP